MGDEDKKIFLSINSRSWLVATIIFLMFIFVISIVNSIFFFRIYNQSKDRDNGTGINGLSVKGSYAIGIISIIISIISFAWSIYLVIKNTKYGEDVKEWYTTKKTKFADWKKQQSEKMKSIKTAFNFFKSTGESDLVALEKAQMICSKMGYNKTGPIPTAPMYDYGAEVPNVNPFGMA